MAKPVLFVFTPCLQGPIPNYAAENSKGNTFLHIYLKDMLISSRQIAKFCNDTGSPKELLLYYRMEAHRG